MRRNILVMIADDLGRTLGCCDERWLRTPHIDALAADGTLFDRAFASTASCSGSRSTIYTGLHTHQNGMYGLHHDHHFFQTFPHVDTAPKLLHARGYRTGIIGKVHVGPDEAYPWESREASTTRDVAWVAERADAFFGDTSTDARPFFLTIGYVDPHRDTTRGGFGNDASYRGIRERTLDPAEVGVPPFLSDIAEVRTELADYGRSIERLDSGVGLVLGALERHGLADETLVCFLSDNGAPFLNSKTTLYDAGIHLPLIVRAPGQSRGVVNPNLVSFTDLLPTWLDWADADTPPHVGAAPEREGRSLLPILEVTTRLADRDAVLGSHTFHEITNYYPTRYLRTSRWKYHRNVAWQLDFPFSGDLYGSLSWEGMRRDKPVRIGERTLSAYVRRGPEELYDLYADPQEVQDLSRAPEHRETLLALRTRLEDWQRRTSDPWLFRDGVSLRAIAHHIDAGLELPASFDMVLDNAPSDKR